MKTLLVDMSPIFYRWLFSSTTYATNNLKLKKGEDGLIEFNEYKDIYIFRTLDYLSKFKNRFDVDEVVLAIDSKPYWRERHWAGYKYGRKNNDESGIDWKAASKVQREMISKLKDFTTFKVVDIDGAEGDDCLFVLSKELSDRGHSVIVKSLDHDLIYTLENKNVKYWRTAHTSANKVCSFVEFDQEEITTLQYEHCMFGDKGDYLLHAKAYSQFSEKFKELYPDRTELQVWPKRHEIDMAFRNKHGESAYKHPRFGAKSYAKKKIKDGFTDEDFFKENPIYRKNFELNKQLGLPSGIPDDIRTSIIEEYDTANTELNIAELNSYFISYGLINLVGHIGLF